MADNYDGYTSSSTYGESDMSDGGEQVEQTALYINNQIQQKENEIQQKQNVVQRTNTGQPPLNPELNDMWIDYSQTPNVIYQWDGTSWVRASVVSADEVGAYTTAQVDDSLNNINNNMTNISSRVSTNEEQLADGEGLAATVTSTTTYQNVQTQGFNDGMNNWVSGMQNETTAQNTLPSFVTQSQLTNKANEITASFSKAGGVNLLKNSVGYGGLLHWQVSSGSAEQYVGDDCIEAGSGLTMTDGTISQTIPAIAGQAYTLTAKVSKGTAGSAYMKLSDGTTFQQVNMISTAAYNYDIIQIANFIPANNVLIVELNGTGVTGGVIFTAIMLNTGTQGYQWSQANGEVYATGVTFDINGVKVQSNQYDGYTVMSPSEFSGYYRNNQGTMQKVFTLNKDTTEVAKLSVTDSEIDMGAIKVLYINGGGHMGWAFVPSN